MADYYPRARKGIQGHFITAVHGDSVEYRCTDFHRTEHDAWDELEAKQGEPMTREYKNPYSGVVWN